ncbi:MAG: hypothetical protein WC277_11185 [Bacilli bacterium]
MPAHRRTLPDSIPLFGLVIVALLLLTPAASAELLTDEGSNYVTFDLESASRYGYSIIKVFKIYKIEDWDGLYFVYAKTKHIQNPSVLMTNPSYNREVTLKIGDDVIGTGTAHYNGLFDSAGDVTGIQVWLDIDSWDSTGYTGTQKVSITPSSGTLFNGVKLGYTTHDQVSPTQPIGFHVDAYDLASPITAIHMARAHYYWQNDIHISDEFVSLTRNLDGNEYASNLQITSDSGYFADDSINNIDVPYIGTGTWNVTNPHGRIFEGTLVSDGVVPNAVTVYVRNSQTGALLADAHIEIQDTTTDPWTEVVNQTLPSGQGTISLAKDPGIHLTQYRIGVTVPGYQQVVPALFFRVVGPMNVVVEMEPVEGGPVNEDNAYLEFYVRDLNANGIANANVQVDGQLRWTNAQGYTQIEVAKNASYPYSVSKSGYVTIEGTATVADGPRYVVNVVLGPGEVPTYTPTPTAPGATPTPDHRTNEQKGQAVIDMIADNAEGIGALALICLLMGLLKLLAKW